jgi:lauroyl/myristoyl acyltransferase
VSRSDSGVDVRWHAGVLNNGLFFGAMYQLVTRLPRRWCYALAYPFTWLAYRLMHEGTRALLENFRGVRPEASEPELHRLALLTYRSYARDFVDFIRALPMTRTEFEPLIAGFDGYRFDELLAEGRGILLAGGHFGNWELGGIVIRLLRGYRLVVVGRPEASPAVTAMRRRLRESLGIETIEIGRMLDTALQIRRVLSDNAIVAMLLDRHLGRDRVEVTFFGRSTSFVKSPAMIAYLSGAPLLPSFVIRQADGRFAAVCGTPIWPDATKSPDDNIKEMTQAFATALESRIRADPHLWYQFYPYWGSGPEARHAAVQDRDSNLDASSAAIEAPALGRQRRS